MPYIGRYFRSVALCHSIRDRQGHCPSGDRLTVRTLRLLAGFTLLLIPRPAAAQETTEYYGSDALGSIRVVLDQTGGVVARTEYMPFGEEVFAPGLMPKQRFTGQERDGEAGMDNFSARMNQPRNGRFVTVDPIFDAVADPQSWGRYTYVRNSPTVLTDPTGKDGNCNADGYIEINIPIKTNSAPDAGTSGVFRASVTCQVRDSSIPDPTTPNTVPTGPTDPTGPSTPNPGTPDPGNPPTQDPGTPPGDPPKRDPNCFSKDFVARFKGANATAKQLMVAPMKLAIGMAAANLAGRGLGTITWWQLARGTAAGLVGEGNVVALVGAATTSSAVGAVALAAAFEIGVTAGAAYAAHQDCSR